jgi:trigger factor
MNGAPMEGGSGENVQLLGRGRMRFRDTTGRRRLVKTRIKAVPRRLPEWEMARQSAEFSIQVGEVAEEHLPEVDEEFIRSFGVESGTKEDFTDDIRKNMANEFAARAKAEIKRQLLELLLQANPIDIPVALVEQEATSLQADAMRNLGITDVSAAPSLESFRGTAERRVRLGLLIGALIREQGLVVDRERVRERIEQLSGGYEKPDEIRKLYYQTPSCCAGRELRARGAGGRLACRRRDCVEAHGIPALAGS